jgi:hypothetical protein
MRARNVQHALHTDLDPVVQEGILQRHQRQPPLTTQLKTLQCQWQRGSRSGLAEKREQGATVLSHGTRGSSPALLYPVQESLTEHASEANHKKERDKNPNGFIDEALPTQVV